MGDRVNICCATAPKSGLVIGLWVSVWTSETKPRIAKSACVTDSLSLALKRSANMANNELTNKESAVVKPGDAA